MTKPHAEHKSQLYFKKYRYAIEVKYSGSRFLGYLDLGRVARQFNSSAVSIWAPRHEHTLEQTLEVATGLINLGSDVKLITHWYNMFVYTNDAADHARLCKIPHIRVAGYRQALVTQPTGVLLRRNPKYQYRSYFRERRVEGTQGQDFLQFVVSRGDYFNLDLATRMRLASGKHRYPFARHSFIEHNSPLDLTMIELVMPGAIRQTLPVQAK